MRIDGDRDTLRNCRFIGFQDTTLANRGRLYLEGCTIIGAVDFIFVGATAYFTKCNIHCVREGHITAASTPAEQPFTSTFFILTDIGEAIGPEGWHNCRQPDARPLAG